MATKLVVDNLFTDDDPQVYCYEDGTVTTVPLTGVVPERTVRLKRPLTLKNIERQLMPLFKGDIQ